MPKLTKEQTSFLPIDMNEITSLYRSLYLSGDENDCLSQLQSVALKIGASDLEVLQIFKALILTTGSTNDLKNLVQLFIRKTSCLIDEKQVLKDENLAKQMFTAVKDFWSLVSNQHVVITQQAFGSYFPDLYDILPSLASVYVDLFIAAHRNQGQTEKLAKRLYNWLVFELNVRCMKTALLEVTECSKEGAAFLLPLLRKLISEPPHENSHMDYLLHIVLLKKWSFVCSELMSFVHASSNIKAPKKFVDWLSQHWHSDKDHFPADKSLKGRRVTEVLLALDQQSTDELIDVFSERLWSVDQGLEGSETLSVGEQETSGQELTEKLFVIDKKGDETKKRPQTEDKSPPRKKKKVWSAGDTNNKPADASYLSDSVFILQGMFDEEPGEKSHLQSETRSEKPMQPLRKTSVVQEGQTKLEYVTNPETSTSDRIPAVLPSKKEFTSVFKGMSPFPNKETEKNTIIKDSDDEVEEEDMDYKESEMENKDVDRIDEEGDNEGKMEKEKIGKKMDRSHTANETLKSVGGLDFVTDKTQSQSEDEKDVGTVAEEDDDEDKMESEDEESDDTKEKKSREVVIVYEEKEKTGRKMDISGIASETFGSEGVLDFVIDRTLTQSASEMNNFKPVKSEKEQVDSYFTDKSSEPVNTSKIECTNKNNCTKTQVIDGMEIQIFNVIEDLPGSADVRGGMSEASLHQSSPGKKSEMTESPTKMRRISPKKSIESDKVKSGSNMQESDSDISVTSSILSESDDKASTRARYFLRTNCSHRVDSETPSRETISADSDSQGTPKRNLRSKKMATPRSVDESPKNSSDDSRRKSLRSASKQK